ncbi:hypothetical protein ACU8OS_35405 (plasmid) [Rhizobium leguminosarum]
MFYSSMTALTLLVSLCLAAAFPAELEAAQCGDRSLGIEAGNLTGLTAADGTSSIELLAQGEQVELCVRTLHCAWKSAAAPSALLGDFAERATGDAVCPPTVDRYSIVDRTVVSRCALPNDLAQALHGADAMVTHISPSAQCGRPGAFLESEAHLLSVNDTPVFQANVSLSTLCAVLGIELTGKRRTYLAFQHRCPQTEIEAARIASEWIGTTTTTLKSISVGAIIQDIGFGVTSSDTMFSKQDEVDIFTWGSGVDQGYMEKWLTSVKAAAFSNRPQADSPVIPGDETSIGKLSRWIAAAASRLDAKLYDGADPNWVTSSQARDWMARTYLAAPDDLEGTLFRVELARKQKGQP